MVVDTTVVVGSTVVDVVGVVVVCIDVVGATVVVVATNGEYLFNNVITPCFGIIPHSMTVITVYNLL